jgi:hypothetical protein
MRGQKTVEQKLLIKKEQGAEKGGPFRAMSIIERM